MTANTAMVARFFSRDAMVRRIIARIEKRRSPTALPHELEHRSIFVVPTAFGFSFGVLLIFMALGGLNFNNNMALLLVFLIGAITQMTTMMAYRNLRGLRVESVRSEPVFAGEQAHVDVHLSNPESRERYTLVMGLATGPACDCIDMKPQSSGRLGFRISTRSRGWLDVPSFRLETRYPLGMFRAWTWIFPDARCLVYPKPAQHPPPLPHTGAGQSGQAQKGEGDQVHGLRNYQSGDPMRRIAWRTSARHDELYTREMEKPQEEACTLSWNLLQGMDAEDRLSVLTAWVLMADHRQVSYSLDLPERALAADSGPDHRALCLAALALHGS